MRLKLAIVGLMASSLMAAPVMASAAPALTGAKASNVKVATAPKKANKLSPALIGLAFIAAGGLGYVAVDAIVDSSDSK